MIRLQRVAVLLLGLPVLLGQGQPSSSERPGAKIWVGRNQEIEEYLRTAECVRIDYKPGSSGAGRCTFRPGGPVARMIWKPLPPGVYRGFRESYKAEIAAYEVDKLLKMDMVPPTVERQLEGHYGAAQLWVENIVDSNTNAPGEANRADWEDQLVRTRMFDNLIGYRDRSPGNMLHDADWHLILIDHSRAFGDGTEIPHKLNRIDPRLWSRIESLTRNQLDAALGAWLDDAEIKAILDRREKMRADIRLLPR